MRSGLIPLALEPVEDVVHRIRDFRAAGVDTLTIRFPSWDQRGQLRRFIEEVAPAL